MKIFPTDVLVRDFWQDLLSVDAAIVLFLISTSCHIKIVLPRNKKVKLLDYLIKTSFWGENSLEMEHEL